MEKVVVYIPVRGGSRSIPLKNIKEISGKPLVYWTAKAACEANLVDGVYVATDSAEIRESIEGFMQSEKELFSKLSVISRSAENASDTASTESAMLEFADNYDFENIVLVQATSPLLRGEDIDGGINLFFSPGTDSVLSVVEQKRFLWRNEAGVAHAVNYDIYNRPRRQDFEGYLMENGAFYITSKDALQRTKNRISGKIRTYIMPADTALEIDEPADFIIQEQLLIKRNHDQKNGDNKFIKMVVTDCDGCLTDGGMYYSENGDELKKFNTKDGAALAMLRKQGVSVGIITGENRALNKRRSDKLKMDFIIQGVSDKKTALVDICKDKNISLNEVLYIGDDFNDLDAMSVAGYSACPADATREILAVADYVSSKKGGMGAVRDIIDEFIGIQLSDNNQ